MHGTAPVPMDTDETPMPGAFPDPSSLQPLLTSTPTQDTPVPIDPTVRPHRTEKRPARFRDILPEPPVPAPPKPRLPTVYLMVTNPLTTALNTFGLFRNYLFHPSYDPDLVVDPSDLSNLGTRAPPPLPPKSNETDREPPWPFSNMSIWRLMQWMNTGSRSKSEGEVNRLVNGVLNAPDFCTEDLRNFNAHRENGRLDKADRTSPLDDGFQVASVTIEVPTGEPSDSETSRQYSVPGLHYRKLLGVIRAAFLDPLSLHFHLTPFSLMHRSPVTGVEQRVYGELYHSDAFIKEYHRVQNCSRPPPDDPGCKLEKVIAALMFWSDSTHLTNFGTATLWPIYLFFGNLSKYIRSRPSSGACNHIAYIPSVRHTVTVTRALSRHLIDIFRSFQTRLKVGSQAGTHTGRPSATNSWLTAAVSSCKRSGSICWTMTSFMLPYMASSSHVMMGSGDVFTRGSSRTLLIIRKSELDLI